MLFPLEGEWGVTGVHQETPTDQPSMLLSSTAGRKTLQNHSMKFAPSVQPESNIELLYVPPECQAFPLYTVQWG